MRYCCKFINLYYFIILFCSLNLIAQENIAITGKVLDQNGYEIPYAAIGILNKNIGSTSLIRLILRI